MTSGSIPLGTKGTFSLEVDEKHCTKRGDHLIFSTPNMVQLLEWAAIEALRPYLSDAEISVGTMVEVRHLAPTPRGARVKADAIVRECAGSRVLFAVDIFDDREKIGEAMHERFVLDRDRYLRRLEKKLAAVAQP